jgi:type IV pilus assembly protein PilW
MQQAGLTIVELMVSIVIGIILVLGAISMLVTSKQTYVIQEDLARIQESGRLAMEIMQNDIRMSGYGGCSNDFIQVKFAPPVPPPNDAFGAPIEAYEAGAANWAPGGGGLPGNIVVTSDGITVRHIGGQTSALTADMTLATDAIPAANFGITGIAAISDCFAADVFAVGGLGGVAAPGLSKPYRATDNAVLSQATFVRYFVGTDANGDPALFRTLNGVTQQLVDGVEMMQITYGEDSSGDGLPDQYVAGNAVGNWNDIAAVRIGLLMRSADQVASDTDTFAYDVDADGVVDFNGPGDRRRRRVMTTTIFLRNDST